MAGLVSFGTFAVWDWIDFLRGTHRHPAATTLATILVLGVGAWRLILLTKRGVRLFDGARGERAVGTLLDDLRSSGYLAFHDLELRAKDSTFNADHVLVGPAGVFVIETKYSSKPARGPTEISVENGQLLRNGKPVLGNPMGQAITIAEDVGTKLYEHTGLKPAITPVVVYPGWFVADHLEPKCWVLNPERLLSHVRRARRCLSDVEIDRLRKALDRIDSQRQNW